MSNNSLSALDFVVSVLREHEKELTALSEQLETALVEVRGENLRRSLYELSNSVQSLSQAVGSLSERLDSQLSLDTGLKGAVDDLKEESRRQKAQLNSILDQLRSLPTQDDFEDLRRAIDALRTNVTKQGHAVPAKG